MRINNQILNFNNKKIDEYFDQCIINLVKNNQFCYFQKCKSRDKDMLYLFDKLNDYIKEINIFSLEKKDIQEYLNLYAIILYDSIIILEKLKEMYDTGYDFTYFYADELYNTLAMKFSKNKQIDMLHPLILSIIYELYKYYDSDFKKLNKLSVKKNNINLIFLNNIYNSFLSKNLENNLIYNNKLYFAYSINKFNKIKFEKFNFVSSYYNILDLRLFEKIESKYKKLEQKKRNIIKIAIFGNMHIKKIKNILKDKNICASIDVFHIKEKNELIFEKKINNGIENKICLYNFNEINRLLKDYDLIFLLDNGYFYLPFEKDLSSFFYTKKDIKTDKSIEITSFYIKQLYTQFNTLYEGFLTNKVTDYKYNEKLYYLLNNAVQNSNCEIYIYIAKESENQKQLFLNSIFCKDEYYNGYNATVIKLSKQFNINNNFKNITKDIDNKNCIFSFKLWKLFKSISNDFCFDLFDSYKSNKVFEKLYQTDVYLKFEFDNLSINKISYYINEKNNAELMQTANDFLSFYLNIIFSNQNFYFKKIIEKIFYSILLSSSKNIEDLFIVYLMKYHLANISTIEITRSKINISVYKNKNCNQLSFQIKKQIEMIMLNLDQLILRNSTNKIKFIEEHFCLDNNISYKILKPIIITIQKLCEKYNYISCNLYTNIKDFEN